MLCTNLVKENSMDLSNLSSMERFIICPYNQIYGTTYQFENYIIQFFSKNYLPEKYYSIIQNNILLVLFLNF